MKSKSSEHAVNPSQMEIKASITDAVQNLGSFMQILHKWAIMSGFVRITYDKEQDLRLIMGEPEKSRSGCYHEIVQAYQRVISQNYEALIESYESFLAEILRPVPLSLQTRTKKEP